MDRVYFDIVKKDFPANNYKYSKPGYEFIGWYLDEALTQPFDFSEASNKITKNITLYLKTKKSLKPDISSIEHKVTFITPSDANPLFPTYVKHGSKLNPNYSLSSILTRKLEDGSFEALDYWTIVDPVTNKDTGVKYDFNQPVNGDLILKAHMKSYKFPTIERKIQFKVYDTIQNKVLFEKTLTLRDGKIQSVDKLEISRVLNCRPGDFDTKYGKYTFDNWYINSDKNTPFNLNNLVPTNLGNLNVYAVYNYEANNSIPDPENPANQTTELDSRSAKVSFLSDTFNLISLQVMRKGEVFSGSLPSVSKSGYRFKYWAYYENGKVEGEFKTTHKIYKNTTLYPVFEKDPNATLNQTQTKTVKIFNELLQVTEIFHVEKGSLLGLDTTRYNNNLGKYRYDFAKFTYKDGSDFNHLTTKISEDLELTVKHEKRPNSEFKEFNFKIYDPVRNETIFEGKIAHKNGEIYAPDFDKIKQALKQTPADIAQAHGRYQFKGWYLSDLTTQFKLTKTIDPATKQVNVFALYKYFANSDVPNPEDPSGAQNFGADTVKVSFLSETMGLISVQTQKKGKNFQGILPAYTKLGYRFKHWAHYQDGEVKGEFNPDAQIDTNTTLYPVFEPDPAAQEELKQSELVDVTIKNPLLKSSEVIKVKKNSKLGVEPSRYDSIFGLYKYQFKRFKTENDSTFDYLNQVISKPLTLEIEHEKTPYGRVEYTIRHEIEGVDQTPDQVIERKNSALVDTVISVSESDRLAEYSTGFDLEIKDPHTQTLRPGENPVFTLRYKRKIYSVKYDYKTGELNGKTEKTIDYKFNQTLKDVKHPTKVDPTAHFLYNFLGWKNPETGEIIDFSKNHLVTKNLVLEAVWQEINNTCKVHLKLTFETLDNSPSEVVELEIEKARVIGTTAKVTDADIAKVLTDYLTAHPHPNHESMFAPSSITEITVSETNEKQYLSLEYKAKTYKVNFEQGDATQDSTNDIPSETTLKYTQTLDSALVQKMKSVKKAPSQYKDYEFKRLVVKETGEEFVPTRAYNQDITVEPEFQEQEVRVNVVPKVKSTDLAKTNKPVWPAQNLVVGTHFNFTPTTNIKPGWDFVGWAKTEDGAVEDIVIERTTTEVFAVFKPGQTTYKIKHVFEGVDDIQERTEYITKPATTESTVTLTDADKLPGNDAGFIAEIPQESKTIQADGSTEFTINYKRRLFDVNFTVNYQNKFEGRPSPNPKTQKVKYEGKVNIPGVPTIEKHGRTYLFKHWQLESSMNGVYTEQTAYDFANKVTKDITLVAYFEEIINRVTYKVVHYLEKTGKSASLNDQYDRIEEVKTDQKVEDGATYLDYAQLDTDLYEKDTTHPKNKLNSQLDTDDNSVEVCQYYKIKEVEVRFKKTAGIDSLQYETRKVKKTRSVPLPTYTLKDTHNFVGWALSETGQTQNEFVVEKTTSSLEIYALTDYQNREITYTIRKEKTDGTFEETQEIKTGKITSTHTVSYANPDSSVYQNPTYSTSSLVVNADKNQNKIAITILRKTYQVTFEVVYDSSSIPTRTIRHGAKIGEIDESQFTAKGLVIRKTELDYVEMTKEEIEEFIVLKTMK